MPFFVPTDDPPLLLVGNTTSRIVNADRALLFELDQALSVEVPGAKYAMRHRPGWDGRFHPLSPITGILPTGLVGQLRQLIPSILMEDHRERPHTIPLNPKILTKPLRDYQFQCLQAFFATDRGLLSGRGVAEIGVAGGKTAVGLAAACHIPGKCVVVVNNRKDLFHQWREEIRILTGDDPACIGDGAWDDRASQFETKFVLVMPGAVGKDLKAFGMIVRDATLVIADEAHNTSGAPVWASVVMAVPAYFRLGLTGTLPEQADKALRLKGTTGGVFFRIKQAALSAMGYTAPCTIILHRISNPGVFGDWHSVRRQLIEDNSGRNEAIAEITAEEAEKGKRVLVTTDTVRHARTLRDLLVARGIDARFVTGKQGSSFRNRVRQEMRTGGAQVALGTVFDIGVDIPRLDCVVIAAGGKSSVRFSQRVGRALRTAPGKTGATIHDFADTGHRWVIRHSAMRLEIARREKFTIQAGRTWQGKPGEPPRSVVDEVEVHEPGIVTEEE